MLSKSIRLAEVFCSCQHLQVPRNMQTTDNLAAKRHDVVDFVSYSCGPCKGGGVLIDATDRDEIAPWWRGSELDGCSFGDIRGDDARIGFLPRIIVLSQLGSALQSVLRLVSIPVFFIASVPLIEAIRVICSVFLQSCAGALAACVVQPIRRCRAFGVSLVRLLGTAHVARLHFAWMWASMMRLTSSAMEMPRRFASRLRNALCGSVNEIICLVIGLFTADLVLAPSGGSKNPNHVWSDVWVCPYERGYAGADSLFMVSSSRSASAIRVHECNPAYYGGQLVARHFLRHAVSIPQGIQVGHA